MIAQLQGQHFDAVIIGGDFADSRTPIDRIHENLTLLTSLDQPILFGAIMTEKLGRKTEGHFTGISGSNNCQ